MSQKSAIAIVAVMGSVFGAFVCGACSHPSGAGAPTPEAVYICASDGVSTNEGVPGGVCLESATAGHSPKGIAGYNAVIHTDAPTTHAQLYWRLDPMNDAAAAQSIRCKCERKK
ncbi:hypothetical protein [Labilithrix luteola]|uniref:hypothetical protein n=1 Tax=Labilithrix luteola TaxID=1391654 RepID=UPI0011BA533C|nr:hypothetical protein [Labilithrix luteola]